MTKVLHAVAIALAPRHRFGRAVIAIGLVAARRAVAQVTPAVAAPDEHGIASHAVVESNKKNNLLQCGALKNVSRNLLAKL